MLTGKGAMMAVFSPDGKYAYVANAGDANVSIVDVKQRQEVKTISAGKGVMAFEPAKSWKTAWVPGPDEDKVVIVDLVNWEKVGAIDVPGEPRGLSGLSHKTWRYLSHTIC
jgi:YVTN family beta-propeller protein